MPQIIDDLEERLRQNVERTIAFELHVHRLSSVIVVRFLYFFIPYFPDLVIRSLFLVLLAQPVARNFVPKETTTCKLFSKGHAFFILPCDAFVYILR